MDSLVPHADQLTPDQWNEVTVFNGEKLYKTGFWNLLYRVLTSEAYQFMDDAGGYYTNVANSTSVLSLPVFEFGPSVRYRTLVAGYEALPRAVAKAFVDEDGEIHRNCRLDRFAKHGDAYAMLFVRTTTDARRLHGCAHHPRAEGDAQGVGQADRARDAAALARARALGSVHRESIRAAI